MSDDPTQPGELDLQSVDDELRGAWRDINDGFTESAEERIQTVIDRLTDSAGASHVFYGEHRGDVGADDLPTIDLSDSEVDQ